MIINFNKKIMKTIKIRFLRRPHNFGFAYRPGAHIELPTDQKTAKMIAQGICEPVDEPNSQFKEMIVSEQEKYKKKMPEIRILKSYAT